MIAWTPRPPHTAVPADEEKAFLAVLEGRAFTQVTPNVYVVTLTYEGEWIEIVKGLQEAAKEHAAAWLVISPPISGGRYQGWLQSDRWEELNKRTTP